MAWEFILTDLNGNVHGEVTQATERKVSLPHLRVPSASFKIPTRHYLANTVLSSDCLVKAYRTYESTRTLVFNGPVISADENGEAGAQSVSVSAAGPMWRLSKRIIPGSKVKETGWSMGSPAALEHLGAIARAIISTVNAELSNKGYTGIELGTFTTDPGGAQGFVEKWYLKNAAEAIAELSTAIDSFEYVVAPTEPTAVGKPWPQIGSFNVAPVIGSSRPDAIFEYGTPKANVASYTRQISRDNLLTNAIVSVSGWPDGVEKTSGGVDKYSIVQVPGGAGSAAIDSRGLFEEVISDAGILENSLRSDLASYHISLRDHPREVLTFRPATNARPTPFIDYNVGDTVRALAVVHGTMRFNAEFRIWGLSFDIDQNGNENVELELVTPT